ncbi:hypothetical protein Pelo_14776 [Pelomyxa schiedti]|nr:hypothetical protein Pelo_14776 [Pelomyxa schiedti]
MTTLGYCGQQSLALLLLHHPRCGAHRLHALPPHFIEPVCRLLLRCSASPVELETRMGYDVQVGREMWHLAANQPGRDPMMGDSLPLVYVWRDDGRVVLSISPWSNGAWKLWQGYENWQQVFSRLNQKEVESLLVPDQAAVIPVVGHTGMSYGKVLRKGSLQFEKLPQGLLIRFLGGCNGEILIPVANNPTIFFTADRTYSSTISSRCPISILKKRLF